jgi:RNA polymerase sigma-70 factor (ECF subfamily)
MSEESGAGDQGFEALIRRVREGDGQAAAELVKRYEPAIRRAARVRLHDTRLNRLFDSMDICQSVLASFFVRTALGQYDLETPDQLLKLLATMARNKLANAVKGHAAGRRDFRRVEAADARGGRDDPAGSAGMEALAALGPSPSSEVAARELLHEARRRLSPEDLSLLERRQEGQAWAEIAAERGVSPEAIRKRLARSIDRVARELGIDESDLSA